MGSFDNTGNSPVPGGSLAKPVMIALGALLVGKMLKGNKDEAEQPAPLSEGTSTGAGEGMLGSILGGVGNMLGDAGNAQAAPMPGELSGGLGSLLEKLTQAGHGDKVQSWLGQGENAPIDPNHLGDAIGSSTINQVAQHAGIDPQELLTQLSQVLPGVVDKLTTGGKIPDLNELSSLLQNR
ncbi:YidB family protein [Falsochrobactrum ovis]|uniref:Uncharacterized protein YidB (DUF937 family) n=1 Tax=Falsochrobactrum ovis TaxID=1293442 RepID=A0A364JZU4_9HYPH|nr:YidB family protein [Falsochrobactrum ovis]RAK34252.1 uncharacterized protein YidB (DUF937 family) [Falsochrobactrum ovis]